MMKSTMILSLSKFAFLAVLVASTTAIASASSGMESSHLRGGNDVSTSRDGNTSKLTHGFSPSSAIIDTVRKLDVGCANITNTCDNEGYFPTECKIQSNREYFRNKCEAGLAGYDVSDNGEGNCDLTKKCQKIEEVPVTCDDGITWPNQCLAKAYGKCKF